MKKLERKKFLKFFPKFLIENNLEFSLLYPLFHRTQKTRPIRELEHNIFGEFCFFFRIEYYCTSRRLSIEGLCAIIQIGNIQTADKSTHKECNTMCVLSSLCQQFPPLSPILFLFFSFLFIVFLFSLSIFFYSTNFLVTFSLLFLFYLYAQEKSQETIIFFLILFCDCYIFSFFLLYFSLVSYILYVHSRFSSRLLFYCSITLFECAALSAKCSILGRH